MKTEFQKALTGPLVVILSISPIARKEQDEHIHSEREPVEDVIGFQPPPAFTAVSIWDEVIVA